MCITVLSKILIERAEAESIGFALHCFFSPYNLLYFDCVQDTHVHVHTSMHIYIHTRFYDTRDIVYMLKKSFES